MSRPSIPGFTRGPDGSTLADVWSQPSGGLPEALWPRSSLAEITGQPLGWIVVEEYHFDAASRGGRGMVLVAADQDAHALGYSSWLGHSIGEISQWDDGRVDAGIHGREEGIDVEFFVQVRRPQGSSQPELEFSQPFLWYFDAYRVSDGWKYLNGAGREQDLIRWSHTDDEWKVEVRALELRQFLHVSGKTAVSQVDLTTIISHDEFSRIDDEITNKWAKFTFFAVHDSSIDDERPAFSGIMGRYLIQGLKNSRTNRWEQYTGPQEYEDFIYNIDPDTGSYMKHTCNPDELGTYFDSDDRRLHYLTPIYFKREVLQPYAAEPSKYQITGSRLSCLSLWGVAISINTAGLVEVYLGDLGRDLPADERPHWIAYNVPPEGDMDRGRFERDFLNRPAPSNDPVGDLRRIRRRVAELAEEVLGTPIWRPLAGTDRAEFESLMGPLNEDPSSLGQPLLVLTKTLVDAIDGRRLKRRVSTPPEEGEKSLRTLARFMTEIGDEGDCTKILRDLQAFRSRGGIAHLSNSQRSTVEAELGIQGATPTKAFDIVVKRLIESFESVEALIERQRQP